MRNHALLGSVALAVVAFFFLGYAPAGVRAAVLVSCAVALVVLRNPRLRAWGRKLPTLPPTANPQSPVVPPPVDLASARLIRRHRHSPEQRRLDLSRSLDRAPLVVISNREPYLHERDPAGDLVVRRPAGGLVTALEPLLRACGGTWIAHGSGSADRVSLNSDGTVPVPPGQSSYSLKRVFLSDQEVQNYYCGFSNEALWPLCHRVHVRPQFRHDDWRGYQQVNARFAEAAIPQAHRSPILVQDYHLALVPRRIREAVPDAAIGHFWHIPWPTAQMFAICPSAGEILDGLLGADVVGFHTDEYSRNFLESVSRMVSGCEVDFEERFVAARGHRTLVRTYPISIEWPATEVSRDEGFSLRRELAIDQDIHVSVGVDRADYTKGLIEKVHAVETLLEENPDLIENYTLVQIAAPSRQAIGRYQEFTSELRAEVARINGRFASTSWEPIVLLVASFSSEEVQRYFAMANSALVTPLHDGMNLVAKEYVASCTDNQGVLVLSEFAGAAAELQDALLVNPYDRRQVAGAIRRAVEMPALQRIQHMQRLRAAVKRNTIHDWSANLLQDLGSVRRDRSRGGTGELLHTRGA